MSDEAERGKATADRIGELSQSDPRATDSDFAAMVRRVGVAMGAGGEDFMSAGAGLAQYLLSDRPIEAGERRLLALLVLGETRRAPSRPAANIARKADIVAAFRAAMAKGRLRKNVIADLSGQFGLCRSSVEANLKDAREREEILAEMGRVYSKP